MSDAVIVIEGSTALLTGAVTKPLQDLLRPLDPDRRYNLAFREKRWDGRVDLFEGRRFPAGLVNRVQGWFIDRRRPCAIKGSPDHYWRVDMSAFKPDILPGITLYDHQMRACMAALQQQRGVIKSPTGSGKSEMTAALAKFFYEQRGWTSLVMVPKKGLAKQTVARFRGYFKDNISVGQCGDGQKTIGAVTVATVQTLVGYQNRSVKGRVKLADPALAKLIRTVDVLFLDETHHASAYTWFDIAMAAKQARRRYGLSGTPLKADELADLRMEGATGPIICEIPATQLIDNGLAARPKIVMVMAENASEPELPPVPAFKPENRAKGKMRPMPYPDAYKAGIIESVKHNTAVVRATAWMTDQRRRTVIICRRLDHFAVLQKMLDERGIRYGAAYGGTETQERDRLKALLKSKQIDVILATTIFDEGEDVPSIEAIILAEGVKVSTNALQRVGRGMRRKKGENDVWIVDFVPLCHPTLTKHAQLRCEAYEAEGYEVQIVETWPHPDVTEYDEASLLPFKAWEQAYAATAGA